MKIRYFSDLHLEFLSSPKKVEKLCYKINPDCDEICILAGDIGNPRSQNYRLFMDFINKSFQKTFIIAGNHEYYGSTINETNQFMTEFFGAYKNITFLNNSCEIYQNYNFIGTTLWSKITNPQIAEINDVYKIGDFDYITYNRLNMMAVDFLENAITDNSIIITHHVPSYSLIDIKYKTPKMQPYNKWFYCDMDSFIVENKNKICAWFYGHTHTPNFTTIENIPFFCNAIGYPNENSVINFEEKIVLPDLCFDVSTT